MGSWNEAVPVVGDPIGLGYKNIQDLMILVRERANKEHSWPNNSSSVRDGLHQQGSAVLIFKTGAGDPVARPGTGLALTDGDAGLLMYHEDEKVFKVYKSVADGWIEVNAFLAMTADTINETSPDHGVDIEGVHFEDNDMTVTDITATKATVGTVVIEGERVSCKALKLGGQPAVPQDGDIWMV